MLWLLIPVLASGETVWIACSSRANDAPFREDGAPVQFIHVPKCAGSTLQNSLQKIGKNQSLARYVWDNVWDNSDLNHVKPGKKDFEFLNGSYYAGHRPIGWGMTFDMTALSRPIFITILRDPIERLISLYDFICESLERRNGVLVMTSTDDPTLAERARIATQLWSKEKDLLAEGVNETATMSEMVMRDESTLNLIARRSSEFVWFLPELPEDSEDHCSRGDVGTDSALLTVDALAVAVNNLLRVDVVALTENITDLAPQLLYHAPFLDLTALTELLSEKVNAVQRPKQILTKANIEQLRSVETVIFDTVFYSAASAIARSRTHRALYAGDDWCPVDFTDDVATLLQRALDLVSPSCERARLIPDAWKPEDVFLLAKSLEDDDDHH